jgi:hypothetical protein
MALPKFPLLGRTLNSRKLSPCLPYDLALSLPLKALRTKSKEDRVRLAVWQTLLSSCGLIWFCGCASQPLVYRGMIVPNLPTVQSICFAPHGSYLAAAYGDGTVRIWDVARGTLVKSIPGSSRSRHLFADLSQPVVKRTGHRAATLEQVVKFIPRLQIQHLKNPEAKALRLHPAQATLHRHVCAVPVTNRGSLPCALSVQPKEYRLPREGRIYVGPESASGLHPCAHPDTIGTQWEHLPKARRAERQRPGVEGF